MDAATTEEREKSTATAGTEATSETVGIQATQTATPAEDSNSDHGGVAVCVDWIPTVSAVASVPTVVVGFSISSVATASISLTASIVIFSVLLLALHLLL